MVMLCFTENLINCLKYKDIHSVLFSHTAHIYCVVDMQDFKICVEQFNLRKGFSKLSLWEYAPDCPLLNYDETLSFSSLQGITVKLYLM